ncbi:DUF11 domain-containing protein [Candidatus Saccharibacteria bacterium]|nr:DUF11 domain-containing protein [Candidatus Saccharibacteria bacterium]
MKEKLKQIGFYFGRLKKERVIIGAALVFTVFAVVIQSFSVFNQPDPAAAAPSNNDIIYGGVYSKQATVNACNSNTQGFRDLLAYYYITCDDLSRGSWANYRSGDYAYSFGRTQQYARQGSVNIGGSVYYYGTPPSPNYVTAGLLGTSSVTGDSFAIMSDCGNLFLKKLPPAPCPHNPKLPTGHPSCQPPTAWCNSLTATPATGTAGKTEFNFHIDGGLAYGATWSGYYMNYSKDGGPWVRGVTASLNPNGSGGAYNNGAHWKTTFSEAGTYRVQGYLNTTNAGNNITDANKCVKTVTVVAPKPSYDLEKKVDKTSAKPGETIKYTLTFKNTGEVDLTNVVIKDQLPSGINWTNVDINVTNGSGITEKENLFTAGVKVASVKVGGTVTIVVTAKVADNAVPADKCGENKRTFVNKAQAVAKEKQTEDRTDNNEASTDVTVNRVCTPNFDIEKKVDKKTARPGETLQYTLSFKNTGEVDLTNVIVKDVLPANVTLSGDVKVEPSTGVTGDLFSEEGLKIAKVEVGKTVIITFNVKVAGKDDLVCGKTILTNVVSSSTSELAQEPNAKNNTAKTEVEKDCKPVKKPCPTNPSITEDDERCKPCAYDSSMNADNPNCVPPVVPPVNPPAPTPTPTPTPSEPPSKGYTPEYIVASGPGETFAGILGAGMLTFSAIAYGISLRATRRF